MVSVFLKYKLYEFCINTIFNGIKRNFNQPESNEIKRGDRFKTVDVYHSNANLTELLTNVTLTYIKPVRFMGEDIHTYVFTDILTGEQHHLMGHLKNIEKM